MMDSVHQQHCSFREYSVGEIEAILTLYSDILVTQNPVKWYISVFQNALLMYKFFISMPLLYS